MDLKSYITLGRTGLRVSPLCLGAMTFGTQWGWGADETVSRSLFDRYVDAGGNFVDTADGYQGGQSEQMCGKFINERKLRDQIVLATKFTFNGSPGNPNSGGNGRKNIYRAIDASLRRLNTDFIDLYWLHAWDTVTPVEEVVNTLTDLVRAGKIRHYGFSDTPAWYVARAHTLAEQQGKEGVTALQLEYSLIERNIEREHIPAAQELGIGICPWSPLAAASSPANTSARATPEPVTDASPRAARSTNSPRTTGVSWKCCWERARNLENQPRRWRFSGPSRNPASHPPFWAPATWRSSTTTWRRSNSLSPPIFASAWTKPARSSQCIPTYSSEE